MRNRVGGRVVDRHGSNLTKVAAVTQFTLPGLPAMFAGDEIGASYEPYSEFTTIPWRDRYGLRPFYERLFGCPPRRSRNGVVAYGWTPKPLAVDLVEARLFTGLGRSSICVTASVKLGADALNGVSLVNGAWCSGLGTPVAIKP